MEDIEMALRNIVTEGDDILTKKCREVEKFDEKAPGMLARLTNSYEKYNNYFKFYGEDQGSYETDYFEYDATVNNIVIPSWYCSYHRRGKLVFLSKDYMVCVCTHDKDYKQEELIYLEIFQRISKSERQTWVKRCPNYGIRV